MRSLVILPHGDPAPCAGKRTVVSGKLARKMVSIVRHIKSIIARFGPPSWSFTNFWSAEREVLSALASVLGTCLVHWFVTVR
jgi:hypothetical protein